MYKVKLTKIKSSHNNLRTDEIEGETEHLPEVGRSFILKAEPLENLEANFRSVYTTEIEHVEKHENGYRFNTKNSIYHLEVLDESEKQT